MGKGRWRQRSPKKPRQPQRPASVLDHVMSIERKKKEDAHAEAEYLERIKKTGGEITCMR